MNRQETAVTGPTQSMATSTADRIEVRGLDLCEELIGSVSFTDMIFLEAVGRLPDSSERELLDAVLVTVTEHGLTPSSLAARLTFLGEPGSLQGAVAAGLLGAGSVYLGAMEDGVRLLVELVDRAAGPDEVHEALMQRVRAGGRIPGVGHPIHTNGDPRVPVLYATAARLGFGTSHQRMLDVVREQAQSVIGRPVPINAGGAIAAVLSDAGLPSRLARGLAVIGRAAGLVGHVLDEIRSPVAQDVWRSSDETVTYQRPQWEQHG